MSIETLLQEEIQVELEELKNMEVGSDKHKTTVDSVVKMSDRVIEMRKLDIESRAKEREREIELKLKREQMKEDRTSRHWKDGIAIAGIGVPAVVMFVGLAVTLVFEEKGTITSIMGRGIVQKFVPNFFKK